MILHSKHTGRERRFTDEMANEARRRYVAGEFVSVLAKDYGVSGLVIESALLGREFYASQHYSRFRDWPRAVRTPEGEAIARKGKGKGMREWNARPENRMPRGPQPPAWRESRARRMREIMQERRAKIEGPPADIHAILAAQAAEAAEDAQDLADARAAMAEARRLGQKPVRYVPQNSKVEKLIARMRKNAAIVR